MGKEFLEARKGRYTRKVDETRQKEVGTPDLINSIRNLLERLICFRCSQDADPEVGTVVKLVLVPDKRLAQVYSGNSKARIGEVIPADTAQLRALAAANSNTLSFLAFVCEKKDWSDCAKARLDPLK